MYIRIFKLNTLHSVFYILLALLFGLFIYLYNSKYSYYILEREKSFVVTSNICSYSEDIKLIPLLNYVDFEIINSEFKDDNFRIEFDFGEPLSPYMIALKGWDLNRIDLEREMSRISSLILEREQLIFNKRYKDVILRCGSGQYNAYNFMQSDDSMLNWKPTRRKNILSIFFTSLIPLLLLILLNYIYGLIYGYTKE